MPDDVDRRRRITQESIDRGALTVALDVISTAPGHDGDMPLTYEHGRELWTEIRSLRGEVEGQKENAEHFAAKAAEAVVERDEARAALADSVPKASVAAEATVFEMYSQDTERTGMEAYATAAERLRELLSATYTEQKVVPVEEIDRVIADLDGYTRRSGAHARSVVVGALRKLTAKAIIIRTEASCTAATS